MRSTCVPSAGFQFGAALIDPDFPATDLQEALEVLRLRLEAPDLRFVASGEDPCDETRERLRGAGVELALWEPVGDNTLRFQLNGALSAVEPRFIRGETRVPTEWRARVFRGGRQKAVGVYSVSGGGAFLATPQPAMSGAEIALELPLPTGRVNVDGRVVYTNVPGNLRSDKLPNGMAVRFQATHGPEIDAIRDAIERTWASLAL